MSKYTTEVRYICENYAGLKESVGYKPQIIDNIIGSAEKKIFTDYPIFDENYRAVLNTKILRHYYTREICAETVGLWELWLNNTMNEIMPYYNELYKSALIKFNPMYDVDITTTHSGNESGTNTERKDEDVTENRIKSGNRSETSNNSENGKIEDEGESGTNKTGTTHNLNKYSDTPQGGITGMQIEDNMYLTNATINDGSTSDNTDTTTANTRTINNNYSGNSNGTENENIDDSINRIGTRNGSFNNLSSYTERVAGKRNDVSYSKLLTEFRQTFLNIDMMIIKELENLFFKLY